MKKMMKRAALTGALICLLLALFTVCAYAAEQKVDAISYKMDLKLDAKKNTLTEKVTIRVKNNTGKTVKELCLRDMTPAVLKYDMKNYGYDNKKLKTRVSSVTLKGSKKKLKLRYAKGKTVIWVKLGKKGKLKPGETGAVVVKMKTDIPKRQDRFGWQKTKNGRHYALSFCFPYLADNRNGKWQKDPYFDDGESRSWDLANYYVTFRAPKGYMVAATGTGKTSKGVTKITAKKVRDFAIVACDFMKKDTFRVKGVRVNNYYLKGKYQKTYRKFSKMVAKDSLRIFTEQIGKYPYKELDIVPCNFGMGYGGMEYPGLVMTNAASFLSGSYCDCWSLSDGLSHEIGHQWFYAVVGNREYREGWIDEGFTSYLEKDVYGLTDCEANRYLRKIDKMVSSIDVWRADRDDLIATARQDWKGTKINTAPGKYSGGQEYGPAEYDESYMFLQEVRLQLGDKRFAEFLRDYYKAFRFKVVTTRDVVKMIRSYDNSKEMNEILNFYIRM